MNSILNFRATQEGHLSDQQVDDQLVGDLAPEASKHLASCAPCSRRVAEASAPIVHFRAMAMEWSERRSATMPLQAVASNKPRWAQRFALGTATAALLAGVFALHQSHAPVASQSAQLPALAAAQTIVQAPMAPPVVVKASMASAPKASEEAAEDATISRDNEMLQQIDVALSTPTASPASLGLEMVSDGQSAPQHTPGLLQD